MSSPSPKRILFVCLGNICRSPAAAIILRHLAREAGRENDFTIDSAGTAGHQAGLPPDPRMADALMRHGYQVTGMARHISPDDLESSDLVVTMDEANLMDVLQLDPTGSLHAKVRPFVSFCRRHDDPRVPDPYYGGQRGFDHVISLLRDGCEGILEAPDLDGGYQETTSSVPA
jgi:protein-tyrosine phosphatase